MARIPSKLTTLLGTGLLLGTLAPSSGCLWFSGYDGVYIEAEDVSIELPDEGFRSDGAKGDLWWLINQTATDTNTWVTTVVETTGYVVEFLNNHRETSVDGEWRVYGPFDDNGGRDIAWLVRVAGTPEIDTTFEFLVAPRGTTDEGQFELMSEGHLSVEDELRFGTMHIDFDTIENYPDLDVTYLWSYAGDITIDFERNVDSGDKSITIDFDEFHAMRTGYLDDDNFYSDETYEYHKAGDKSGSFHLALMGEWDHSYGWSGPEQERMQLDMVWTPEQSGRAYGTITEVEGKGDMLHGDLSLDECFDGAGVLSYRALNEAYANEVPGYNFGEADSCVVEPL